MKGKVHISSIAFSVISLILLISDTETATKGASEGIELCTKVLIPSLFPFFLVVSYANTIIVGNRCTVLKKLERILNLPAGAESIMLLGFLGGYPVGAKLISDHYHKGQLNQREAHVLLGYCSNAGPAFIFGITRLLFSNKFVPLTLWLTLILSAIITAHILPHTEIEIISTIKQQEYTLSEAMQSSIKTCVTVCGWVIIFKIIEYYAANILDNCLPPMLGYFLRGILELSNGCIELQTLNNEPLRYILASGFLAFGGICILLQTKSVTEDLGLGLYIPGKIIQTGISIIMSTLLLASKLPHQIFFGIIIFSSISIILTNIIVKKRYGNSHAHHV